ncbi:MAG: 4-alpha-glucanotransferase [Anaerolineae bacterium]
MSNLFPRSSGILVHPTSLPGKYGIGDLGDGVYQFLDWLADHGQSIWQILPLGPTSYGDSPYQTLSAFAGNPNLIALDKLVSDYGWLKPDDLDDVPDFPDGHVDYGWIIPYHDEKLSLAYEGFKTKGTKEQREGFQNFVKDNASWLEDYALFAALKRHYGGKAWVEWDDPALVRYEADALKKARKAHADAVEEQRFRQWVFYRQWYWVKYYAAQKGIRIFGDIPIFVAHDSSDVWANQDLFYLRDDGQPTVIAGVPPDYFSPTGQRWGNPLYRWDVMKNNQYAWWIERFKAAFTLVDYVRIDHFRGFEAYWQINASEPTAINGEWIPGPGQDFFKVVKAALGELPIIAEDLGVITEGVEALRDNFNLPGMKVLQFAWSDPSNPFLPHNHVENCVVYSGTHDNNTTIGWFHDEVDEGTLDFMKMYLEREINEINWRMMQVAMMSPAHTAIFPMQDVLNLGSEARMNTPGKEGGNWTWRFTEDAFEHEGKNRLGHLTWLYRRRPDQQDKVYGDAATKK